MRITPLLYVALLLSCPLPAFAQAPVEDEAALRPGDAVQITVWRKPELSGEFFVAADGSIADPFYSEVNVAGVPLATASGRIREYVARIETSPRIWVEPLFRVSVGGEVRQPDLFSLRRETTVAQAVAQAGGASERGNPRRVQLIRGNEVRVVDLTDPRDRLAHAPIRSGDQIFVTRRASIFRDYVAPSASVVAAAGVILNIFLR